MLSFAILTCNLFAVQMDTGVVDPGLIASRGFQASRPITRENIDNCEVVSAGFRREGEFASIDLAATHFLGISGKQSFIQRVNRTMQLGTLADWPQGGWSGLPAGDESHSVYSRTSGSAHIYIFYGAYVVHAILNYSGTGAPGHITWSGNDKPGDRLAVEGFCRDILANAVGARLRSASNVNVNGHVITGVKQDDGGNRYVPISAWCLARNIVLAENRPHGTGSFSYGGKQFVLPVAAEKIKAGTEWKDLNGFLVRSGGRWYAPLQGLENAIGASGP